jgi:hypothetical protein
MGQTAPWRVRVAKVPREERPNSSVCDDQVRGHENALSFLDRVKRARDFEPETGDGGVQ